MFSINRETHCDDDETECWNYLPNDVFQRNSWKYLFNCWGQIRNNNISILQTYNAQVKNKLLKRSGIAEWIERNREQSDKCVGFAYRTEIASISGCNKWISSIICDDRKMCRISAFNRLNIQIMKMAIDLRIEVTHDIRIVGVFFDNLFFFVRNVMRIIMLLEKKTIILTFVGTLAISK